MITIQMRNGMLDVGSGQDIAIEVMNIRFSGGLRDIYTNDISLPKTANNIKILDCYNLLDSPNQLYGTHIQPAVLTVDGYMMNCYIQVVSVNDTTIDVCLYELVIPNELRDKPLRDILLDTDNSIYTWNAYSRNKFPNNFFLYDYGSRYFNEYAQIHPVKSVNEILSEIENVTGYEMPSTDDDLVLLAQNKYICPQNKKQSVCVALAGSQNLVIIGGQHIVNDIQGWDGHTKIQDSDVTEMAFNRDCSGRFRAYISWGRKTNAGTNTYVVSMFRNGVFETSWTISTSVGGRRNGYIQSALHTININKGDIFTFRLDSPTTDNPQNRFDLVEMILDFEWLEYEINEDDYNQELTYCYAPPNLLAWQPNDLTDTHLFDGSTRTFYIYNASGTLNESESFSLTLPNRAYSYMGYYCNLSEITLGGLLNSLCWYNGYGIEHTDNGGVRFTNIDKSKIIEGKITTISPTTDYLGQRNFIIYNGQDTEKANPLTGIDSVWLEYEKILMESAFSYIKTNAIGRAKINQYTVKYDYDGNGEAEFHEIDGQVAFRKQTPENIQTIHNLQLIPPHEMQTMGLDKITSSTQVQIETFTDEVSNKDYIYLDGRKYMVVSVTTDLVNKKSTITALLVPTL